MDYILEELKRLKIEEKLKEILYFENIKQHSIEWGMNYITFSPSKRVRPLLVLESNLSYSQLDADSYLLGAAIELIHTYSLVHDDLPCMDNDDLRRGLETLHKVKSEAYAVLVGDALLTRAFGILSNYSKIEKLPLILKYFNEKAGARGMIYGQNFDLEAEGQNLEIEAINEINEHKTGRLLELCFVVGAINAGCDKTDLDRMEKLGSIVGHIFQIQDDILDIVGNKELMGKNTGSDEKNEKSSIPLIIGIAKAKELILDYKQQAFNLIEELPSNKYFFNKFIDFLINRAK
ncbi:MAG: hypothetical protein A2086_10090 [Spirochaetes bacterium GWD1_27_9]|nr:MAG: hypothetical protein A2Z98_05535 [Spirochaetes bacterium GWB1_27_13]OHD23731.1 MAG: hypothetical protein A2Y34_17655 [Spirochaetes bacterium GWC1_27_15]OHD42279.1 MAG: hypothetical protein A2086_10090 [Spirochaetes bacterium GWD1_27_9]